MRRRRGGEEEEEEGTGRHRIQLPSKLVRELEGVKSGRQTRALSVGDWNLDRKQKRSELKERKKLKRQMNHQRKLRMLQVSKKRQPENDRKRKREVVLEGRGGKKHRTKKKTKIEREVDEDSDEDSWRIRHYGQLLGKKTKEDLNDGLDDILRGLSAGKVGCREYSGDEVESEDYVFSREECLEAEEEEEEDFQREIVEKRSGEEKGRGREEEEERKVEDGEDMKKKKMIENKNEMDKTSQEQFTSIIQPGMQPPQPPPPPSSSSSSSPPSPPLPSDLLRSLRGLLNRISESNLLFISKRIRLLFDTFPRAVATKALFLQIQRDCETTGPAFRSVSDVYAGLVLFLVKKVDAEIGRRLLFSLVKQYHAHYHLLHSDSCKNYVVLLGHLLKIRLYHSSFCFSLHLYLEMECSFCFIFPFFFVNFNSTLNFSFYFHYFFLSFLFCLINLQTSSCDFFFLLNMHLANPILTRVRSFLIAVYWQRF